MEFSKDYRVSFFLKIGNFSYGLPITVIGIT